MKKIFGTDGIRGLANVYPMTIDVCMKLAKAVAIKFCNSIDKKSVVIIGKDTRISCDMFEYSMAAAFCSFGVDVQLLGIIPTPSVPILISELKADMGIVISASHNPFSDNGVKLFNKLGLKLTDHEESELEEFIFDNSPPSRIVTGEKIGNISFNNSALLFYYNKIKNSFKFNKTDVSKIKIVVDSSNGALSHIAPKIFEAFGFITTSIHNSPNGLNINDNCGATSPQSLVDTVLSCKADIGIAFDGDGDRVIIVDEKGGLIDGDHILAILAQSGNLKNTKIVSTIMSNFALEKYLESHQIKLVRTSVGDRYISEYMQKHDVEIGGEPSGHIIIKSHSLTGDGLFVSLKVIEYLLKSNKLSSELKNTFKLYPTVSNNISVSDKSIIENHKIVSEIKKFETLLKNRGTLIVRPSGTESIIRISAEGENLSELQEIVDSISETICNTK